jgi:hypothetical protein
VCVVVVRGGMGSPQRTIEEGREKKRQQPTSSEQPQQRQAEGQAGHTQKGIIAKAGYDSLYPLPGLVPLCSRPSPLPCLRRLSSLVLARRAEFAQSWMRSARQRSMRALLESVLRANLLELYCARRCFSRRWRLDPSRLLTFFSNRVL